MNWKSTSNNCHRTSHKSVHCQNQLNRPISNWRAENYGIEPADRSKSKRIAGRIIPAIATTTAMVAGLISAELYKIAAKCDDIEKYRNTFMNLALPVYSFSEPMPAPKNTYSVIRRGPYGIGSILMVVSLMAVR